jgi:hypothetical protein
MKLAILTGMQSEAATVPASPDVLVLCGTAARDALDARVPADVGAILSWGVCGALSPALPIGAVCVATRLIVAGPSVTTRGVTGGFDTTLLPSALWTSRLLALLHPPLVVRSITTFSDAQEIASTPANRAKLLLGSHASAVDMGSYAVAALAQKRNIPWAAVGAVSDAWDQTVSQFYGVVNPDGSVNDWAALESILGDPASIPAVVDEAWTEQAALHSLGVAAAMLVSQGWGCQINE